MKQGSRVLRQTITRDVALPYAEFLPGSYPENPPSANGWPLVIFLHGAGERGSDVEGVNITGLTAEAVKGREFPFLLIAPLCPAETRWEQHVEELELLLRHCISRYQVDTSRIYMTGLSLGGYGTWHFAAIHPHALAAIAPICGGGERLFGYPERIRSIVHLPVWAFHGDADTVVPPEMSSELIDELKAAGAPEAKLTIYPGVEHDSWTQTYDKPELYEWMLGKQNLSFAL